ncbi:helix-turn-helix domain-containing protein [Vallitalea sp. AN17-2]|uniref:Helix-turn-helix domain-containing protein n=1 Tax=Vallitalea maricola TaxID=3074433 RepID=A0ACB5UDH8_9FIRM|nr:helix-turn-helix domain-containing protein [Vallitalea sp. AN17-2]
MAKHSYETKKKVVLAYLSGEGGAGYIGEKYGVARAMVQKWVAAYKEFGDEGLRRSRKNETYTFKFKLHVVELYLTTEVSYQDLALSVGINNPPLITKWVNDFRIVGPDALRSKRKGRKKTVKKSNNSTPNEQSEKESVVTSIEHVKQLENELLKLKIENAYLKELRRLRLEEETLLKKQRELSTASEENSN